MAPIHNAARTGNLNRVRELLNQGAPVNARNEHGWTPLHYAANTGRLSIVQELLKHGAHVNPRTISGFTPLHWAAHTGRPQVVHALLKAGANPLYRTIYGQSAYNYTVKDFRNAVRTSRAATKWNNMVRKRRAARMLASPRLLGSTILNNKSISNIARYLTVKRKRKNNNNR